jgi:hypothetical protein
MLSHLSTNRHVIDDDNSDIHDARNGDKGAPSNYHIPFHEGKKRTRQNKNMPVITKLTEPEMYEQTHIDAVSIDFSVFFSMSS